MELVPDLDEECRKNSPLRIGKALLELTSGYDEEPSQFFKTFQVGDYDQLIATKKIPFTSLCEHHLLPFSGSVSIGYIPKSRVIGISKLIRIVQAIARRLQTQERLTAEIAEILESNLKPEGVIVVIEAKHSCVELRGVKVPDTPVVTSVLKGKFREELQPRQEFFAISR